MYDENTQITVRLATPADSGALRRLAALDSAEAPSSPALLAQSGDGAPLAALPLNGGRAIADPFQHTLGAVQILELRAAQLRAAEARRRPTGYGERWRSALRALSPRTH